MAAADAVVAAEAAVEVKPFLCACSQESLLADPSMKNEYGEGLGMMSVCLVCKRLDDKVARLVGAHPSVAGGHHDQIAKAQNSADLKAAALQQALAKSQQAEENHRKLSQTMNALHTWLDSQLGPQANGVQVNVARLDPTVLARLWFAQNFVTPDEVAAVVSHKNHLVMAFFNAPVPKEEDLAFLLMQTRLSHDKAAAEKGAFVLPDKPVGSEIKTGALASYIKSVVDALKKKVTPAVPSGQWISTLHAYAMLLKLVAQMPADAAGGPLVQESQLIAAAEKFHLLARNLDYALSAFSPLLPPQDAHALCTDLWFRLMATVSSSMEPMKTLLALNLGMDGPFVSKLIEAAQRKRDAKWDEPQAAKRSAADAPGAASKPKAQKSDLKASPTGPRQTRASRELQSGESKPHADSKAAADAAGRTGPQGPHLCNSFRDGNCAAGDACNSFHLCWYCWAKARLPYGECMHAYDDCAHKAQFLQKPPPRKRDE
jgi:hypothetical protein